MSNRYPYKRDAKLRFCDFAMTLDEVGRELGISRERVRQLENRGLRKAKVILARRGYTLGDLIGGGDPHG